MESSGNLCEDYFSPRKRTCHRNKLNNGMKMLFIILVTNLLTIFIINGPISRFQYSNLGFSESQPLNYTSIALKLSSIQNELVTTKSYAEGLKNELESARSMVRDLQLRYDDLIVNTNDETKLSLGFHKLPLGSTQSMGNEIVFSYGSKCLKLKEELKKYMTYQVGGVCPIDDVSAQKLMLMGCEPLPRRRCHPKSPVNYTEPTPLPKSLWSTPPDSSLVWDSYPCKNYTCLVQRWRYPGTFDCKDCFDLRRREASRWLFDRDIDYGIDHVLGLKPKGTIRIGLDIGGGAGTFAVRMMERNVTVLTTSMNFDAPFNSFISSRGLLSMHLTISQRFPFFENTLDIVHSMHVLSNWMPEIMFEFILYDVYRILRPGGLFWLDHFFCFARQLNGTYAPMFDRVGFKVLKWNTGKKADKGVDKKELYLSALFEKPMT